MKGERMAKRSSLGRIVRKRLSDITNSPLQPKSFGGEEKPPQEVILTEEYVNNLLKENLTLMNLIAERNKIIEFSGAELQKLRNNCQKLQLQNWNLAQANSQMLAELNSGRERMRKLQHELLCKDALLKAKNLELEGKAVLNNRQNTDSQGRQEAVEEPMQKAKRNDRPTSNRRRASSRSQSMGPLTTTQQDMEKEKAENKRRCLRRQSARFKSQETEATENLFEIDEVRFSVSEKSDNSVQKSGASLLLSSPGNQVAQRSSIGRPLRRAAEKVQSYKEIPVNIKMRRPE